jgi:hypothetical protein
MERIADVVRAVEKKPPEATRRGKRDPATSKEVRWAVTGTNAKYPSYPIEGPCYVVKFGELVPSPDPPYPGAEVTQALSPYDPEWSELAVDPDGNTYDEGTIVRVERHDGRWWIRPQGTATPTTNYLANTWGTTSTSGGIYVDGSSTADTSPFDISSSGSWFFPGLGGITFTSGVASITRTTPTGYSSTCYTLKQRAPYLFTITTLWELPSLSLSNARSLFRGATHSHSYTDDGAPGTTGNTQPDVRSLDDGGVVSVTTTMYTDYTSSALDYWMGTTTCRPFYSADNASHYMMHTSTRMVECRGRSYDTTVRFKVSRDDSVSYCTPRSSALLVAIQQMGYEE